MRERGGRERGGRDGGREREDKHGALVKGHGRQTTVLGKRDRQTDERDERGGVLYLRETWKREGWSRGERDRQTDRERGGRETWCPS